MTRHQILPHPLGGKGCVVRSPNRHLTLCRDIEAAIRFVEAVEAVESGIARTVATERGALRAIANSVRKS